jgi:hypothetical protein
MPRSSTIHLGPFPLDHFIACVHYWREAAAIDGSLQNRAWVVALMLKAAFPLSEYEPGQVLSVMQHNEVGACTAPDKGCQRPFLPRIVAPMMTRGQCPCGGKWGELCQTRKKSATLITADSRSVRCLVFQRFCDKCDLVYGPSYIYRRSKKWRGERNFRHHHKFAMIRLVPP